MTPVAQFFQDWGAMIQTIALLATFVVLAATFVVLIFYTVFTYQLRKETVRQTELQLTPYIILDYIEEEITKDAWLVCKNIGNTSALIVLIETFELQDKSGKLMWKVDFDPLYVLEPNEYKKVASNITYGDEEWKAMGEAFGPKTLFPFFPEEFKVEKYPLPINYENLENVLFKTKAQVKISEREIEILRIERVKK